MLPDSKKYKKVIAWSGDFGMDQYAFLVACQLMNLTQTQFVLNMKNFCKPKANEVCKQGLTCLQAFTRAIDQWMSGTMLYKAQVCLVKYP